MARDVTDTKRSETELRGLLAEQAALRRFATLVAREAEHGEVFAAVAEEVGSLLSADAAGVVRYEPAGRGTVVGAWSRDGAPALPTGTVLQLDGGTAVRRVYETGEAGRSTALRAPGDRWPGDWASSDTDRASLRRPASRAGSGAHSLSPTYGSNR